MIAYKLCRQKKDGGITSLFINKTRALPFGEWLEAEAHPTKGYKYRPYWHCTFAPCAPHLSEKGRVWVKLEIQAYHTEERPRSQGGTWLLAKRIKLLEILKDGQADRAADP